LLLLGLVILLFLLDVKKPTSLRAIRAGEFISLVFWIL
jgi:hypothetical protein